MVRSLLQGAMLFALVAVAASPAGAADKGKTYGAGVKLKAATPVDKLLASPAKWVGKQVRVDGVATGVCKKAGCWIELSDAKTGKGIKFKVEDGVIVFPLTAKGHKASAEGTFEEVVLSPAEAKERASEEAGEHGAEHGDHTHHAAQPKGPTYQIRATGAVIY
ncbi:MAG: DUF4920 domain-containing protein [Candidatus Sericytochromatia bacterium]|nr:DUF4920 domain-containing protein [Candidatus Tanganyikabacteria bacterium]